MRRPPPSHPDRARSPTYPTPHLDHSRRSTPTAAPTASCCRRHARNRLRTRWGNAGAAADREVADFRAPLRRPRVAFDDRRFRCRVLAVVGDHSPAEKQAVSVRRTEETEGTLRRQVLVGKSDGIANGSIQIPGSGQPIIMLTDRQTMGGYPKIATIITPDVRLLLQRRPGECVRFQTVTVEHAHEIARETAACTRRLLQSVRGNTAKTIRSEQLLEYNLAGDAVSALDLA